MMIWLEGRIAQGKTERIERDRNDDQKGENR